MSNIIDLTIDSDKESEDSEGSIDPSEVDGREHTDGVYCEHRSVPDLRYVRLVCKSL